MSMKPIIFNTEMVRAILDGRKIVTRRVVKNIPSDYRFINTEENPDVIFDNDPSEKERVLKGLWATFEAKDDVPIDFPMRKAPYQVGDILYVRETFGYSCWAAFTNETIFKAGASERAEKAVKCGSGWKPSIHMPREAARIFLRVTDISVHRVQDINDENARKEGCVDREDFRRVWNDCYAKPRPIKGDNGIITHYESYPWEDIHETRICKGKPWYVIGNPWVWVIEFERIGREEAYDV